MVWCGADLIWWWCDGVGWRRFGIDDIGFGIGLPIFSGVDYRSYIWVGIGLHRIYIYVYIHVCNTSHWQFSDKLHLLSFGWIIQHFAAEPLHMAPSQSTLRNVELPGLLHESNLVVNFGPTVGYGESLNEIVPSPTDKDAQCWFQIYSGPWINKLVMCKRGQISTVGFLCTIGFMEDMFVYILEFGIGLTQFQFNFDIWQHSTSQLTTPHLKHHIQIHLFILQFSNIFPCLHHSLYFAIIDRLWI